MTKQNKSGFNPNCGYCNIQYVGAGKTKRFLCQQMNMDRPIGIGRMIDLVLCNECQRKLSYKETASSKGSNIPCSTCGKEGSVENPCYAFQDADYTTIVPICLECAWKYGKRIHVKGDI